MEQVPDNDAPIIHSDAQRIRASSVDARQLVAPLMDRIRAAYATDSVFTSMNGSRRSRFFTRQGFWSFRDKPGRDCLVVPSSPKDVLQTDIVRLIHEPNLGGHVGLTKMMELVTRPFYWVSIEQIVSELLL